MASIKHYTHPDWTHTYTKTWRKWLEAYINKPVIGLEIGSFEFRSGDWFMQNILTNESSRLICVDSWAPVWYARIDEVETNWDFNSAEYGNRVRKVKDNSFNGISKLTTEGTEVSFAYIDGSHAAIDVARDGLMVWELLKPDGVIFFDDYSWTHPNVKIPPKEAIDFLLRVLNYSRYEITSDRKQVAIWK